MGIPVPEDLKPSGSVLSAPPRRAGSVSDPRRLIKEITSTPELARLQGLIGGSAMSGFRPRLECVFSSCADMVT